jgi:dTDP-4-amino-4,6-dideoxygalactose transaminase
MTFVATANAIIYTGAQPFFIDSELETGNMDPALLREALEQLTKAGETVAAIVPVDLLGKAVNYTEICAIAEEYGIPVLADAAELAQHTRYLATVDGVEIFGGADDNSDNFWLTSIVADAAVTGWTAAELSAALLEDNIESRPLWKPMHLQPVFADARSHVNGSSEALFEM